MIERVFRQVSSSSFIDEVMVATDDRKIFDHCTNAKIPVLMTSSEHRSGTDRVAEVATHSQANIIINVQGDEPFLPSAYLDTLIEKLSQSKHPIATLVAPGKSTGLFSDPNNVKVVRREDGRALYFSRAGIPYHRDDHSEKRYWQHLGVYAFRAAALQEITNWPPGQLERCERLEQLRWLEGGMDILTVEVAETTIGVDTPEDLDELLVWMDQEGIS